MICRPPSLEHVPAQAGVCIELKLPPPLGRGIESSCWGRKLSGEGKRKKGRGREGKGVKKGRGKGNRVEKWEGGEGNQVRGNSIHPCAQVPKNALLFRASNEKAFKSIHFEEKNVVQH